MAGHDWSRTQFEACPECGADASVVADEGLGPSIVREVAAWGRLLAAADPASVTARPWAVDDPRTWSALDYARHVRDLLAVTADRIRRMLAEDDPAFDRWDHETAVVERCHADRVSVLVAEAMAANARDLAAVLAEAHGTVRDRGGWDRGGILPRGPGERVTIRGQARFVLHEVIHHRDDAEQVLRSCP